MAFLRFLNRFAGVFINPILYLAKSLLVNLGYLVAFPFFIVAIAIGFIIANGVLESLRSLIGATVLAVVGVPFVFLAFLIALPVVVLSDTVRCLYIGIKNGAEKGLLSGLVSLIVDWTKFNLLSVMLMKKSGQRRATEERNERQAETWPAYDPAQFGGDAGPAHNRNVRVDELEAPENRDGFLALTPAELAAAESMTDASDTTLLKRYIELKNELDLLDEAIKSQRIVDGYYLDKDNNDIEDQLIGNGVKVPCLLFKQVEEAPDVWKTVSPTTKVVDKEGVEKMRKVDSRHPLFREDMNAPPKLNGNNTRYCFIEYNGYCAELHELADKIREGLVPQNKTIRRESMSVISDNISSLLFSTGADDNHSASDNEMPQPISQIISQ